MDPKDFMQNAQKMQEALKKISTEMEKVHQERMVTVKAGGDLVELTMNLKKHVQKLDLDPALFSENQQVIAELIMAAFNQAVYEADKVAQEEMARLTKQFNLPM